MDRKNHQEKMTIKYRFEVDNDILRVTACGCDDNMEQVMEYGKAVVDKAQAMQCTRILCDEREMEYRLNTIDTYEYAKFITEYCPHVGKAAVVCRPKYMQIGEFWENVAVNRGLQVMVFDNMKEAEAWISDDDDEDALIE